MTQGFSSWLQSKVITATMLSFLKEKKKDRARKLSLDLIFLLRKRMPLKEAVMIVRELISTREFMQAASTAAIRQAVAKTVEDVLDLDLGGEADDEQSDKLPEE